MKHLAVLCSLLFAGCVMDVEAGYEQDVTEQATFEAQPQPPIGVTPVPVPVLAVQATTTTTPAAGSVTPGMIWPLNRSISSVEVVYHRGPDRTGGPTFLAFVVWNGNYVAHIYCSYFGTAGTQLRNTIATTLATRTAAGPDLGATTTGTPTSGSTPHPPRPTVYPDGEVTFTPAFLQDIKDQGNAALRAVNLQVALPGAPIYDYQAVP